MGNCNSYDSDDGFSYHPDDDICEHCNCPIPPGNQVCVRGAHGAFEMLFTEALSVLCSVSYPLYLCIWLCVAVKCGFVRGGGTGVSRDVCVCVGEGGCVGGIVHWCVSGLLWCALHHVHPEPPKKAHNQVEHQQNSVRKKTKERSFAFLLFSFFSLIGLKLLSNFPQQQLWNYRACRIINNLALNPVSMVTSRSQGRDRQTRNVCAWLLLWRHPLEGVSSVILSWRPAISCLG